MPSSIAWALARFSCSASTASLIIGQRIRFTTNPGLFFTTMGVLPSRLARASVAASAASPVCRPRMTSTSVIIGTGLKKCMPRKRSGWVTTAASAVIEIDDVFEARMASGRAMASTWRRMRSLRSRFSVAASMTRSLRARAW